MLYKLIKNYCFSILLISSIMLGGLAGVLLGEKTYYLKPFGDIFLNLIFTAIVPLIFFSVSSAIFRAGKMKTLGKIMGYMTIVFILTGIVIAVYSLVVVKLFPPAANVDIQLTMPKVIDQVSFYSQIAGIFTVPDFSKLLSHQNMLALIIFSILVGLGVTAAKEKANIFGEFLQSGEAVFMKIFSIIMYYAPLGFFAYFAVLVHELGPQLLEQYAQLALIFYLASLLYFFGMYSCFAFLADRKEGLNLFWKNIWLPATTAIATCSSAASIPANLIATQGMQVPQEISETTIPLGSLIHKDGSVMGGIFKIAFLFGIFQLDFTGFSVILLALGVSLLVGTVMGAIPSGGMLGELLILNIYGFPPSALVVIAAISIIIDPIATLLNVTGNSVSTMLIARLNR